MSAETKFVDYLTKNIKMQIHTNVPARVISFDASTKPPEADVEVLFKTKDNAGKLSNYPLIQSAPVLKHVGDLKKGDVVYLSIAERAMDDLQKVPFDPDMQRMFNLNDAVIVGVFDI